MTSSVRTFAHPHSVFCDRRPNNHCSPSRSPPLHRPCCCALGWTSCSAAAWRVMCVYVFALRASGPPTQCVPPSADATPSSRMWKPRQRLFSKKNAEYMLKFESSEDVWNTRVESLLCTPPPTKIKLFISNLPFSNSEHEPSRRPPYPFTPSRGLMCSAQRRMHFMSDITEKGIARGLCKPGCSGNDLLLLLLKKEHTTSFHRKYRGLWIPWSFWLQYCFCV